MTFKPKVNIEGSYCLLGQFCTCADYGQRWSLRESKAKLDKKTAAIQLSSLERNKTDKKLGGGVLTTPRLTYTPPAHHQAEPAWAGPQNGQVYS